MLATKFSAVHLRHKGLVSLLNLFTLTIIRIAGNWKRALTDKYSVTMESFCQAVNETTSIRDAFARSTQLLQSSYTVEARQLPKTYFKELMQFL